MRYGGMTIVPKLLGMSGTDYPLPQSNLQAQILPHERATDAANVAPRLVLGAAWPNATIGA